MTTPRESIGFSWGMNLIVFLFAGLRFHAQLTKGKKRFIWSDWITFTVVLIIFTNNWLNTRLLLIAQRGLDRARTPMERMVPYALLSQSEYKEYWKLAISAFVITYVELWGIKMTFCAIYLEIASRLTRSLKFWLACVTVFVFATFVVSVIALLAECQPLHRVWAPLTDPSFCSFVSRRSLTIYFTASTAADAAIIIFPLCLISTLKLKARFIKSLGFVMAVGFMSIAASIARYVVLLRVFSNVSGKNTQEQAEIANIWAHIEIVFGFIASCLPIFRVYMRENRPGHGSSGGDGFTWQYFLPAGGRRLLMSLGLTTRSDGSDRSRRSTRSGRSTRSRRAADIPIPMARYDTQNSKAGIMVMEDSSQANLQGHFDDT